MDNYKLKIIYKNVKVYIKMNEAVIKFGDTEKQISPTKKPSFDKKYRY